MAIDIFCTNSHLVEPPQMYAGRLPTKWVDRAPRVVDNEGGGEKWIFEGRNIPLRGSTVAVIWPRSERGNLGVLRYDELRPGFYDAKARLDDMDMDGIAVTVCYSSPAGVGFGGDLFLSAKEPELGIACMQAYNDWFFEEWYGAAPDRYVPVGLTWYGDPVVAAQEVRRNARRGFKGVLFRNPTDLGLPWVGSSHWDPFFAACEETGTLLIHHTQSLAGWPVFPPGGAVWAKGTEQGEHLYLMRSVMFQSSAMEMMVSWIYGGIAARFPKLKTLVSESGGTWLPHLIWRMNWASDYMPFYSDNWPHKGKSPLDVIQQSLVFGTLEVDTALKMMEDYDIAGWMLESDYPHNESVWPDTQDFYAEQLKGVGTEVQKDLKWRNASKLFDHPMPVISAQQKVDAGVARS